MAARCAADVRPGSQSRRLGREPAWRRRRGCSHCGGVVAQLVTCAGRSELAQRSDGGVGSRCPGAALRLSDPVRRVPRCRHVVPRQWRGPHRWSTLECPFSIDQRQLRGLRHDNTRGSKVQMSCPNHSAVDTPQDDLIDDSPDVTCRRIARAAMSRKLEANPVTYTGMDFDVEGLVRRLDRGHRRSKLRSLGRDRRSSGLSTRIRVEPFTDGPVYRVPTARIPYSRNHARATAG